MVWSKVRNFSYLTAALALVAAAACKPHRDQPVTTPGTAGAGEVATLTEGFKLINAAEFRVADYKGKVLLLDFWATWCGPCKMEIPHLVELQREYGDRGLVVVGITLDDNPDKDVPPYAAAVGMNYVNVRGNDALRNEYQIVGLPTIVIYDRAGNQVMKRAGYVEKEVLRQTIEPLLAQPSS